jgi:hypothetical protein
MLLNLDTIIFPRAYIKRKRYKKGLSNISRKTKEMRPDKKLQVLRLHQDGFKKNRNRKDHWIVDLQCLNF